MKKRVPALVLALALALVPRLGRPGHPGQFLSAAKPTPASSPT